MPADPVARRDDQRLKGRAFRLRHETGQNGGPLSFRYLRELRHEPRFPHPGVRGKQHAAAETARGAYPRAVQGVEFTSPADERRIPRVMLGAFRNER